ncbi:MAG: hypothetical protein K0U68_16180 [Gammaproteobacteria bacterium]|nr:hypothetical protein [Gammaproteobacteria bacterium]
MTVILTGCSSFGKGVAEAFLEKQETDDTRECSVWGGAFEGISASLDRQEGKTKVLMTHGVGEHDPGYATMLMEKLGQALDLTVKNKYSRDIKLYHFDNQDQVLGNLRISRLLSKNRQRELLFYELTWSDISAPLKEILAYDNSGEYSFRRAEVNNLLKEFSNSTGPDPMIYLGNQREGILNAFTQSVCWMMAFDWNDMPGRDDEIINCDFKNDRLLEHISIDDYIFISHSLGSRITIDGLDRVAHLSDSITDEDGMLTTEVIVDQLQDKSIPIFMLSNQLPMLQLGRELPRVVGMRQEYCNVEGTHYDDRAFSHITIYAFSDPNDILSYVLPSGFVDKYIDSRMCVDVTNIMINIAHVFDAFGLGTVANPLEAHVGYDSDDRVIAMIANGVGTENSSKLVEERCQWIETIE